MPKAFANSLKNCCSISRELSSKTRTCFILKESPSCLSSIEVSKLFFAARRCQNFLNNYFHFCKCSELRLYLITNCHLFHKLSKCLFYNISRKSSSLIIGIVKRSAFSFFAGPIEAPARTKVVFEEIELPTFPPLSSIIFLSSLLDCFQAL